MVAFRCAHRGTQLSVGWVEDDCIRCRYHGWRYDGSGQCVEQPGEDQAFAERLSIVEGQVRSILAVPLQTDNRVIGLIYLDSPHFVHEFSKDDSALAARSELILLSRA